MTTLTVSVDDEVYQAASQKAAAEDTSLPEVVQGFLSEWTRSAPRPQASAACDERKESFLRFLDEVAARPLKPGPSVGPLNREELYQRGIPGH